MKTTQFFTEKNEFDSAIKLVDKDAINALSLTEAEEAFKVFRLDALIGEGVIDNRADKAVCQLILNKFPELENLCEFTILNKNTEYETIQFTN